MTKLITWAKAHKAWAVTIVVALIGLIIWLFRKFSKKGRRTSYKR